MMALLPCWCTRGMCHTCQQKRVCIHTCAGCGHLFCLCCAHRLGDGWAFVALLVGIWGVMNACGCWHGTWLGLPWHMGIGTGWCCCCWGRWRRVTILLPGRFTIAL